MAAGVRMAKEECIAAGDASSSPAFMPTRRNAKRGRDAAVTIPAPSATIHTYGRVIIDKKEKKRTRCVGCVEMIKQGKKHGGTSSANPTRTSFGCQQCKRMLCLACFNSNWDHEKQRHAVFVN